MTSAPDRLSSVDLESRSDHAFYFKVGAFSHYTHTHTHTHTPTHTHTHPQPPTHRVQRHEHCSHTPTHTRTHAHTHTHTHTHTQKGTLRGLWSKSGHSPPTQGGCSPGPSQ